MWDLTSDGYQAFTEPLLGSLCLACKGDQTCNILGRKQKMQTFICQVFPKTAVRGFACLPPSTSANVEKLFTSPKLSFLHKVMLDRGLLFSRMNIIFSWEQLCKVYCRFYKNSGFGSQTLPCPAQTKTAWNLITNTSLCAGGTPTTFQIWTDINRKMEMAGWWVSWEKPLRVSPRII